MKIADLTEKQPEEVTDDDLLVIEDGEDTKKITVASLRQYLLATSKRDVCSYINELFDRVIAKLEEAKFTIAEVLTYTLNIWIGSDSGNVQMTVYDTKRKKWLTQGELIDMQSYPPVGMVFRPEVQNGYVRLTATEYSIKRFLDDHDETTNPVLAADDAGYIKAHFEGMSHNEIAGITYDRVFLFLDRKDGTEPDPLSLEDTIYVFSTDEESFANAVDYVEEITKLPLCSTCEVCPMRKGDV